MLLLFVGLGNPTPNSEDNRHNVGFKIIDAINQNLVYQSKNQNLKGLLTIEKIEEHKVYAIKPLTFMNNSGICIRELIGISKLMQMTSLFFMMILILILARLKQNLVGLTQDIMELRLLINL